jgi:4-amino-4-deoxy-L-arabinose transferase-like glycosyltransferase
VLLLPNLDAAPLERAEIYFLDAARGMVDSGDWLVPRYQGEPFFDKPILSYVLMAASMSALGPSAGAGRLVSALSAVGLLLATAWLGALLFSRRTGLAGAFVLATTLAFLSFGRIAMSDVLLALFSTLAVAPAVRAYAPAPPRLSGLALGVVAGLGFATKGPIALVIPGLAVLLLLRRHRARPLPVGPGGIALGAAAFVLLGFGWFAAIYARLGAAPLAHFFLRENLERFAGEGFDVGRPAWFYGPAYVAEGLPWSLLLPIALWRLLRADGGDPAGRPGARFLAAWAATVLVPLTLSRGKIDYYLLPLYPAVSLLVGRFLADLPWRRLDRAWVRATLGALALGLGAAVLRTPALPAEWLPGPVARAALVAVFALAALGLVAAAVRPTPLRVAAALGAPVALAWLVLVGAFLPAFARAQPNRLVAEDVRRERSFRPEARLVVCGDPSRARRDVLLHARTTALETCDVWGLAASPEPFLLLVTPAQAASLAALPRWRHVADYRCLPARALTLEGLLASPAPAGLVLGANFTTADPVADRKRRREYRKTIHRERAALGADAAPE